jgi:hypothetical protein
MSEHIQISAKVLGAMVLKDFCPRCFHIKLHIKKLPWQIFPGIFSSLDSYQKKVLHHMIDKGWHMKSIEPSDCFLTEYGKIKAYHKAPHWSKFRLLYEDLNITLSGEMDVILEMADGSFVIIDNKTAKYSKNQDELLPMYKVQLNGYKAICEGTKQFFPISGLFLTYFEPQTDETHAARHSFRDSFDIKFNPKIIRIEEDNKIIRELLEDARKIYDSPHPPDGLVGCKDCQALDSIFYFTRPFPAYEEAMKKITDSRVVGHAKMPDNEVNFTRAGTRIMYDQIRSMF